eukprot:m.218973 g.218973  ORF g.218973 m.218973 type:complete len:73 (+) comp17226_c0_seq10:110-328(+)
MAVPSTPLHQKHLYTYSYIIQQQNLDVSRLQLDSLGVHTSFHNLSSTRERQTDTMRFVARDIGGDSSYVVNE